MTLFIGSFPKLKYIPAIYLHLICSWMTCEDLKYNSILSSGEMGGGLLFSFFDGLLDYRKGHKLFLFNIISTSLNQFLVIDNFKDSQSFLWSLHNDQRRCSCRFTFVQVFATYLIIKLRVLTLWKTVINLHIILNKRQ